MALTSGATLLTPPAPPELAPPELAPPELAPPELDPPELAPPELEPPELAPPELEPPELEPDPPVPTVMFTVAGLEVALRVVFSAVKVKLSVPSKPWAG